MIPVWGSFILISNKSDIIKWLFSIWLKVVFGEEATIRAMLVNEFKLFIIESLFIVIDN